MNDLLELALALRATLAPACARIAIAGSIRRGKTAPKDIELLAIPHIAHSEQFDLFGEAYDVGEVNELEGLIAMLIAGNEWEFDTIVKRNGPRYKRLWHREAHIACDLFITDEKRWGAIYTIRTGPADFSKALAGLALQRGMFVEEGLVHRHRRHYKQQNGESVALPCPRGDKCSLIVPTPEEEAFFEALGVPAWAPEERSLSRLMEIFHCEKSG